MASLKNIVSSFLLAIAISSLIFYAFLNDNKKFRLEFKTFLNINIMNHTNKEDGKQSKVSNACSFSIWQQHLANCKNNMDWISVEQRNKSSRTSANYSTIENLEVGYQNEYTRFTIVSRDRNSRLKHHGGDYWRVDVRGIINMDVMVKDLLNGNYQVEFIAPLPGRYTVEVKLRFSECDGLRNPPPEWFIKGNVQGKGQPAGYLGHFDDYLNERITSFSFEVEQKNPINLTEIYSKTIVSPCYTRCQNIWYPYGFWTKANRWQSYSPANSNKNNAEKQRKRFGRTLYFVGDSMMYRSYLYNHKTSLCRTHFERCMSVYAWTYKVYNDKRDSLNDDHDFDIEKHLKMYTEALQLPSMHSNRSVLVLNYGLHATFTIPFETYKRVIREIIKLVSHYQTLYGVNVIWRTTSSSHRESFENPTATTGRFLTDQRVRLFNAYATHVMCENGIPILDIFPLSASYPDGGTDAVHYNGEVLVEAEKGLASYLQNKLS